MYKLVCFDVDGTLVDGLEFSWSFFHRYFGIDEARRKEAMDAFFSGKISYQDWASHDIELWKEKGATRQDFEKAVEALHLMKGAREVLETLSSHGVKIAVISGSLSIILETLVPDHDTLFSDVYISRLLFDSEDRLESVEATDYDMHRKAVALCEIASKHGIPLSDCAFVGDHHNDVEVCKEVGLGISFNSKSKELDDCAQICIREKDLRLVLPHLIE